ncbi:MAG: hypothetical protein MRZ41_09975 [Eubacterium sp.]|nr:hypothetical protein [Eubacterium sp.]
MSEILQYNMKQLLKTFGCENLYQFEKKREMIQKDGFAFPSKNTMVKLLNPETEDSTIRDSILQDIVDIYNRYYKDEITIEDFKSRCLPFVGRIQLPELYAGLYYTYRSSYDYYYPDREHRVLAGMLYLYIESGKYKARYICGFAHQETLENEYLKEFITNPSLSFSELLNNQKRLNDKEKNYYAYYEGSMSLEEDFCQINLHRPDNFMIKSPKNNISIIIRRYSEDMRDRIRGAIGYNIEKIANMDIALKKIVLSERRFSFDDKFLQQLINDEKYYITDKEDYGLYRYLKESEM